MHFELLEDRRLLAVEPISIVHSGLQGDSGNRASGEFQANARSSVSADGQRVVFDSDAANLVENDVNNYTDVFVRDLASGITSLVSVTLTGSSSTASHFSVNPIISADGRFVAFESSVAASEFVPAVIEDLGIQDIFIRDLTTGQTRLVSSSLAGAAGGDANLLALSDDGRFVLFECTRGDLVAAGVDTNNAADYFVRDMQAGTTILVTAAPSGTAAGGLTAGFRPVDLSGNGRFVAFASAANNLVSGDTNGVADVFVRDLQNSTTTLVSVKVAGAGTGNGFSGYGSDAQGLAISDDGRYVAFYSNSNDLVAGFTDLNGFAPDVYRRDLMDGTTMLVSVNATANGGANRGNTSPADLAMTPDGRFVVFVSMASNLVSGINYETGGENVFVRDLQSGMTRLVSISAAGTSGAAGALAPQISTDGRYAAFKSSDGNLVPGDVNGVTDVFIRDLQVNTTVLASRNRTGSGSGNGASVSKTADLIAMTPSGQTVVYTSLASDLVAADNNGVQDFFAFNATTSSNTLISARSASLPAAYTARYRSRAATASADGRLVLFESFADDLVASGTTGNTSNIYLRDRQTGVTTLVSVDGTGHPGQVSGLPVITSDGRYAFFLRQPIMPIPGAPENALQLYRRDLAANVTTLVSTNAAGLEGVNNGVGAYSVSEDGRYAAFLTGATDVIPGFVDGTPNQFESNLYLRDIQTGITTLVTHSVGTFATGGNGETRFPALSDDGRYLAFGSSASNLVAVDGNGFPDVFVYDRVSGTTRLVSMNHAGTGSGNRSAGGASDRLSLSGDGRYVVFDSRATDLTAVPDQNFVVDVFVRDLATNTTVLVSVNQAGTAAAGGERPVISRDGRYVAFSSESNLTANDTLPGIEDFFVRDLVAGTTTLLSVNAAGTSGGNSFSTFDSQNLAMSADGRVIAFKSSATNLISGYIGNSATEMYVRDLRNNTTTLVSQSFANPNAGSDGLNEDLVISGNGRLVLFSSAGTNLYAGDRNLATDVYAVAIDAVDEPVVDLVTDNVTVSTAGTVGGPIDVSWRVTNSGTANAPGSWQDAIYISVDMALDAGDTLLATVPHTSGLAAGASYQGMVMLDLPAIFAGNFYVLVRADRRYEVAEDNRSNNLAELPGGFAAVIPQLTLDVASAGAFTAPNQARYYQVTVNRDDILQFTLDSSATSGSLELYVRRLGPPTASEFDFAARLPNSPDQAVSVPIGGAPGTYFVMAYSRAGAAAISNFTITARLRGFAVDSIAGTTGSNTGRVTVAVRGARFSNATQAQLADGATSIPATAIDFRDPTLLYATFDLAGRPAGMYDLRATDGTQTATLPDAFTVVPGGADTESLQVFLNAPETVRIGRRSSVTVEYVNTGTTDMVAPLLQLTADRPVLYELDGTGFMATNIQFLGIANEGPAGVLRPGQRGRLLIHFVPDATSAGSPINFTLSGLATEVGTIDWASQKNAWRPDFISAEAWDAIYSNYVASAGTTTGHYHQMLANNATYLSRLGIYTTNINRLVGFEMQQANAAFPGPLAASVLDAELSVPSSALSFSRIALQSIAGRYRLGPLGRGWVHNWEIMALSDPEGNVIVEDGGGRRFFIKQLEGSFRGSFGEFATLSYNAGVARLEEKDGTVIVFRADGELDFVEDPHGNRIAAAYDAAGRLASITHSSGAALTFSYNAAGRLAAVADPAGRTVIYSYNGEHLASVTVQLTGAVDSIRTTGYGYVTGQGTEREHAISSITFADGTHQFFEYDAQGRLIRTNREGGAESITFAYDTDAGVTFTDAAGSTTVLYNEAGQPEVVRDPLGRTSQFDYDAAFNLTQFISGGGNSYSYGYDGRGNLIREVNPLGQATDFSYELQFNRLTSFRDARGNTTSYDYNSKGDLLAITYPNDSQERFSYDPLGNLTESVNRRGHAINYTYDSRGRLTRKNFVDGTHVDFIYDSRDNLLTATDSAGTITRDYDTADRLKKITYPGGRFLEFTYDAGGRRMRSVDQDGFAVNYQYDAAGRLAELTNKDAQRIVLYSYDAAGRPVRKDFGNGTFTTYEYDAADQLLKLTNHAPGGSVNSFFNYTYDVEGRRKSMTAADGTATYGYDAAGQLTSVALPGGRLIQYAYDTAGNRVTVTDNGVTTAYTTNNLNQYTSVGTATFSYDADGNLASRTDGAGTTTYSWNDESQLIGVSGPGGNFSYEYDPFGDRRIATHNGQRTDYMLDPIGFGNVVGEYGADGSLIARYTHGHGLVRRTGPGGAAYYDFDAIGSTVGITNAAGSYVNRYSYLPFGESTTVAAALANPFTYAGQWGIPADASGLFHMRAREYDAATGRFLSDDPIGLAGGDPNFRRYVINSPIDLVDRTGLEPTSTETPMPDFQAGYLADLQEKADKLRERRRQIERESDPIPNRKESRLRVIDKKLDELAYYSLFPWWMVVASPLTIGLPLALLDVDSVDAVGAHDPNEIAGPDGFGDAHHIRPDETLPYTIHFENDPQMATAPAQEVFITGTLGADLDWTTFELGDFGFGSLIVDVPDGLQSYYTRLEYRNQDGTPLLVDVVAGLNLETGAVVWTFRSVDPESGELPAGVFDGFLPVNDSSGRGEGFATYFVRPKANLASGTKIDAQASIVFDVNAPIFTNVFTNTIDAGGPTSSILPLTAADPQPIRVRWSGADDPGGSGVSSYDIYLSVDGGPFTLWLADTTLLTAEYDGIIGHTYAFYSVATDNVGHVEAAPAMADTSTLVVPPLEPGDYDGDKIVELDDYNVWRNSFGQTGVGLAADGNEDGVIDAADYAIWRKYAWRIVHDPLGDYNLDGLINKVDYELWSGSFGQVGENLTADGNQDGVVDSADYAIWRSRNRSIVIIPPAPGSSVSTMSADVAGSADPNGAISHFDTSASREQPVVWPFDDAEDETLAAAAAPALQDEAVDSVLTQWPAQSPADRGESEDSSFIPRLRTPWRASDRSLLVLGLPAFRLADRQVYEDNGPVRYDVRADGDHALVEIDGAFAEVLEWSALGVPAT